MNIINIIKYIDEHLNDFCQRNPSYQIYRIGSSLFASQITIHDIDFCLINENSNINFTDKIMNLKKNFSEKNFLDAAINTHDELLDNEFNQIGDYILLNFNQRIQHFFGFGPIKMPLDEDILIIHLAGPMNTACSNIFFEQFPLFNLIFSKYNLKLGNKNFSDIIHDPKFSESDIREEFTRIYSRSRAIDSPKIKRQCLKRLVLVDLAIKNHPNPYLESVNWTKNMTMEEVLIALETYKMA